MAERIARRMAGGPATPQTDISSELAAMRATLSELQNRLIQIESKVSVPRTQSPWLAGVNASHPSLERFGVEEADRVANSLTFFKTKRLAALSLAASLVITARCVARGVFNRGFRRTLIIERDYPVLCLFRPSMNSR